MNRGQEYASDNASILRGRAWHVYPDPATPGVMAGDNPFSTGDSPISELATVKLPEGVLDFWHLNRNTPGIANAHEGHSYLVITADLVPPRVTPGWMVEPARLEDNFMLDQRDNRWARLVRIIGSTQTRWGPVADCEFQVDRA